MEVTMKAALEAIDELSERGVIDLTWFYTITVRGSSVTLQGQYNTSVMKRLSLKNNVKWSFDGSYFITGTFDLHEVHFYVVLTD